MCVFLNMAYSGFIVVVPIMWPSVELATTKGYLICFKLFVGLC